MIRNATFGAEVDLIPHAIVDKPLALPSSGRFKLERGSDDLDAYQGRDFLLSSPTSDPIAVALRRYYGHPTDTFTIYVDARVDDPGHVVDEVLRFFQIRKEWLLWRRPPALESSRSSRVAAVA